MGGPGLISLEATAGGYSDVGAWGRDEEDAVKQGHSEAVKKCPPGQGSGWVGATVASTSRLGGRVESLAAECAV